MHPPTADAHVVTRDLRPRRLRDQRQVLLQRDVDPAALVGGLRAPERQVGAGLGELLVLLPGDLLQLSSEVASVRLAGITAAAAVVGPPWLPVRR